jgi:hypothetical protein
VKGADITPKVAHLLLPGTVNFLEIMKVLFDGRAIGNGLQNRFNAGIGVGAEECDPAALFPYEQIRRVLSPRTWCRARNV